MNLFLYPKECFARAAERKKLLVIFAAVFLCGVVLGIVFVGTPSIYEYHLNLCDRFLDEVCFSDESVLLIFLQRFAGNAILFVIVLGSGVHRVGLILPPAVLFYRSYTFGGSIALFISVYEATGALVALLLYLPIHLMIDALLLLAFSLSCSRAPRFCFCRHDFLAVVYDLLVFLACVAAVCLFEMLLLLAVFHPIGNIL